MNALTIPDALTIMDAITVPDTEWPDKFSIHIPDHSWSWIPSVTKAQDQIRKAIDAMIAKGYDVTWQHDAPAQRTTIRAIRHNSTTTP